MLLSREFFLKSHAEDVLSHRAFSFTQRDSSHTEGTEVQSFFSRRDVLSRRGAEFFREN